MKRSFLRRHTALKRSAIQRSQKSKHKRKHANPKLLHDYFAARPYCLVCTRLITQVFPLSKGPHHLGPGKNKVDDERCIVALCGQCHNEYHNGYGLPDLVIWWFKEQYEPELFDIEFLWSLRKTLTGQYPVAPDRTVPKWIK